MADWWNSNFKIKRQLTVPAKVFDDDRYCVLQLTGNFSNSYKTRTDLQDIEILYYSEGATPTWTVLASNAEVKTNEEDDIDFLNVEFVRADDVDSISTDYYIYMTNQSLNGIDYRRPILPVEQGYYIKPGVPDAYYTSTSDPTSTTPIPSYPGTYESSIFYSQEAVLESPRFTTSRPTEDWVNGLAKRQGATASFVYSGGGCALRYQAGPDRGILKITKNDGTIINLDTYSSKLEYKIYYFDDEITFDYGFTHTFEVTGDKSPSSSNYYIFIDRMLYTQYDKVSISGEELSGSSNANRYVIGV